VNAGQEKIDTRALGSSTFSTANWRSVVTDDFETYGGGFRAQLADDIRLDLNYTYAEGTSDTRIDGSGGGSFPTVTSELNSFRADFSYGLTERIDVAFTWRHERFDSDDWALQGIDPATLPTILSLGADPYDYSVNYVAASLRYYFGPRKVELPE
jgi:hypothetical protein